MESLSTNSQHKDFQPFFIVGCPRSGTTLLTVLLDRHSRIAVPPETFFFHCFGHLPTNKKYDYDWFLNQCSNGYLSSLQLSCSKFIQRLKQYNADSSSFLRAILEEYGAAQKKLIVGEKTATHLKYVKTIFDWYPNAKVIWIVRDGRDVATAMTRLFHKNLRSHCCTWKMSIELGLQFEQQYADNFYRIHFEDLVSQPKEELTKLCYFLEVDYEESMLDSQVASRAVLKQEFSFKERALKPIDHKRIGDWKGQVTEKQAYMMNSIMGKYLHQLGYKENLNYGSLGNQLWNKIVQIPYNLAFNNVIHPFLHNYRIKLNNFIRAFQPIYAQFSQAAFDWSLLRSLPESQISQPDGASGSK